MWQTILLWWLAIVAIILVVFYLSKRHDKQWARRIDDGVAGGKRGNVWTEQERREWRAKHGG